MLAFEQAQRQLIEAAPRLGTERVATSEAVGRVLAEELRASAPRPAFDHSAMDGYVVAVEDLQGDGPFSMRVVGESRTGGDVPARVEPATVCRIFTGAALPARGNAVLMQEDVTRDGEIARFAQRPPPGQHVRRRGEDIDVGALLFPRGTRIAAHHIALLATMELSRVAVSRRPAVAILSTGDELRDPGDPDRAGSVVDSNGPALAALVRQCGGAPRRMPFARDDPAHTRAALANALEGADVVLTVGGVSVGDHDVVRPALADVGIEIDFWRVAIKPGKPLAVGHAGAKRFLGLPGNPASAMLTFMLFGAPLLRALQGDANPTPSPFAATLEADISHALGRLEFARAQLRWNDGVLCAKALATQMSGSVPSMAWADGVILVPADVASIPAGSSVRVIRFADV